MRTVRRTLMILAGCLAIALSSCEKDDYKKGGLIPGGGEYTPVLLDKVPGRNVVAYCTYYGKSIPDVNAVTQINYAFAELYVKDGEYKGFKLQGEESRFRQIVDLKKKSSGLKILISFSHTVVNPDNAQGGGFSKMSSTEAGRKAFAKDCLAFCQKWGIDGVDIDWEMPGVSWSGHACDPMHDTENFTLLMSQLRQTLGNRYLVTYAGYVKNKVSDDDGSGRYFDLVALKDIVDYVYVMTYDLDAAPHHHSAIDDPRAYWDWKRTFEEYAKAGFPKEKMIFGVPFYARHSFSENPTAIDYKKILTLDESLYKIDNWDDKAGCPYISVKASGAFYAGYDNARSIAVKAEWAMTRGMSGLMCWDYDTDDASGTLRTALWNGVMDKRY